MTRPGEETFEVGTAVSVRAFHVMPELPPPEGERHAHRYRIEVVVRRAELDERGMVCDLDVLSDALAAVAGEVRERDLEPLVGGGGGPATVEAFARWVHGRLANVLRSSGVDSLAVRVFETAIAFGGYEAGLS